jgi:hypothetical protein
LCCIILLLPVFFPGVFENVLPLPVAMSRNGSVPVQTCCMLSLLVCLCIVADGPRFGISQLGLVLVLILLVLWLYWLQLLLAVVL